MDSLIDSLEICLKVYNSQGEKKRLGYKTSVWWALAMEEYGYSIDTATALIVTSQAIASSYV